MIPPSAVRSRLLMLALGILSLLAAMWGGLVRLQWPLPSPVSSLPAGHGPLMIAGYLGAVISLERAVALRKGWMFGAPLLAGLGGLAIALGLPTWIGGLLITLSSLGLVAIFLIIVRRQPELFTWVMALAALLGALGNALYLAGFGVPTLVVWWAGYLVLTVAGERLELSRILFLSTAVKRLFVAAIAIFLIGALFTFANYDLGWRIGGCGLLALALWLLRYDIARRTVRQDGLPQFVAVNLLAGYGWLAVGGLIALVGGTGRLYHYDAILHSIFLGFIFGMIFGHAPVIFPAVLGVPVPFRPAFYAHVALLQVSLAIRLIGDLAHAPLWRQWGGLLNVVTVLLFLANTVRAHLLSRRGATPTAPPPASPR